jgi:hypothetical protein
MHAETFGRYGGFDAWRRELLATGDIVQDDDDRVDDDEAERRFYRYVELLDAVDGTEGPRAVHALIASLFAEQSYGAHETVFGDLELFPPEDLARGSIMATAELLTIPEENSGVVLQLVTLVAGEQGLRSFNEAFGRLPHERSLGKLRALRP